MFEDLINNWQKKLGDGGGGLVQEARPFKRPWSAKLGLTQTAEQMLSAISQPSTNPMTSFLLTVLEDCYVCD